MTKSTILCSLLTIVFGINRFSKLGSPSLTFAAKFYDEKGSFLGNFGTPDDNSPIYIVSCEMLFPEKFMLGNLKMTPQEIIHKVGTEIITDRNEPIIELNVHVGVCKLPPKAHRAEIQKIIEETHLDARIRIRRSRMGVFLSNRLLFTILILAIITNISNSIF